MGFAALETMGYGLVALLQSNGNIGIMEEVLLMRGLLSPLGHAAWTGLVCAALWRGRLLSGRLFGPSAAGFFALAVFLHAAWDIAGTTGEPLIAYPGYAIIGGLSLTLLIRRLRASARLVSVGTPA